MNGTTAYEFSVAPPTAALVKQPLNVPKNRLLMGPGPSNCSPRVCEASSHQILGHMHPEFAQVLDDIKLGLQYLFQTSNPHTLVISGPGHLGMEAVLVNLLEPGDTMLVGVNGLWGHRVADLVTRIGAKPATIETAPGKSFSLAEIEAGLAKHKPQVLFLVHSESSTGVMQPLEGVGALCRKYGCLLAVDTVASLGGTPFFTDKLGIDAIYTGSQKVIGAPPGLSPISFSAAAVDKIQKRKSPIKSFFLDLNLLSVYWACGDKAIPRVYHHTPPVSLLYAMREALSALVEEGLEALWTRHADATKRLHDGIKELGLEFFVPNPADRLPTVTTIKIPEGLKDWKLVPKHAMDKFEVELAGGLGETAGKVYRIGVMGFNATPDKIQRTLAALSESLKFAKL